MKPRKSVYEANEIDEFLDRAVQLATALHEVLTLERFGRVPLTQTDMNIEAGQDLKKTEDEMGPAVCCGGSESDGGR